MYTYIHIHLHLFSIGHAGFYHQRWASNSQNFSVRDAVQARNLDPKSWPLAQNNWSTYLLGIMLRYDKQPKFEASVGPQGLGTYTLLNC